MIDDGAFCWSCHRPYPPFPAPPAHPAPRAHGDLPETLLGSQAAAALAFKLPVFSDIRMAQVMQSIK